MTNVDNDRRLVPEGIEDRPSGSYRGSFLRKFLDDYGPTLPPHYSVRTSTGIKHKIQYAIWWAFGP